MEHDHGHVGIKVICTLDVILNLRSYADKKPGQETWFFRDCSSWSLPLAVLVHYLLGEEHGHIGKWYVQHILWIDEGQNNNLFSGILLFVGTNDADGHHYSIEVYTK